MSNILFVPDFFIKKKAKYFGDKWIWQMGKFSQKEKFSPNDRNLFLDQVSL